jgi:hypothetical protein
LSPRPRHGPPKVANGSPVVAHWTQAARGFGASPARLGWALTEHTEMNGHTARWLCMLDIRRVPNEGRARDQ